MSTVCCDVILERCPLFVVMSVLERCPLFVVMFVVEQCTLFVVMFISERESSDKKRGDDGLKTNHVFVLNTDMAANCLYTAWYEM